MGENVHLSAESVFGLARDECPEISIATVYNTLNELVAMGEVLEVATGPGPKRYDPNVHTAHHHLICTSCGSLQDVAASKEFPELLPHDRFGYVLTGVDVTFHGLCPSCQNVG